MFADKQLSQIYVRDERTGEVLAVINADGSILNPVGIAVVLNYGEPKQFVVKE